ncbi:S41 family peptidase [Thalassobellus sediminis]|uniref:S41 family peptidase n=1 Tax=Thalassobellus sediminis TaxID=3367753 RepID=UPI0037A87BA5
MKKTSNKFILILFTLFSLSCHKKQETPFEQLFNNSLKNIKTYYIKNDVINWFNIEIKVKDSIKQFNSNNDVYNAIDYTLFLINDRHSCFFKPEDNIINNDSLVLPEVQSKIIGNNIGYIKIPGFGANERLSKLFALKIRKTLIELDRSSSLNGWIIDLKDNNGGAGFSQPLGISPLLKDSIISYYKDNKGNFKPIICLNNTFKFGHDDTGVSLNYVNTLINKDKKIAVLINNRTASCGELVAMSLKFQKQTKIFGSRSNGLTTALMPIHYSPSGATLLLSFSYLCDLDKKIVKAIIPDEKCSSEESLEKAIKWIKNDI